MADDIAEKIEENALGPKRAQTDAGSVEQHPIADQILADRYLSSKSAARKTGLGGLRFVRLSPGGTI